MRLTLLILAIATCYPHTLFAFSHTHKIGFSHDFTSHLRLVTDIDYRYEGTDIFQRHYDAGLRVPLTFLDDTALGKSWSFRANYRVVLRKRNFGWDREKRPYVQLQKTFKTAKTELFPELKWSIRNRYEYRIRNNGNDSARNRTRIKLRYNKAIYGAKPFFTNEIFYDFDKRRYDRNRIELGFELPKKHDIKTSLYYRLATDREDGDIFATTDPSSSLVLKIAF